MRKRIDWHSGFSGALGLSFRKYRDVLEIQREVPLTKEPPRIDFLLIRKKQDVVIDNAIGRMFRTYNLIEYKNPTDALNIDVVWKTIGYAGLYKGTAPKVNDIPTEELTVTIIRSAYPRELFRLWKSEGKSIWETAPGVYRIGGVVELPLQIVVTRELLDDDFLAFRVMKRDARVKDTVNFYTIVNGYEDPGDKEDAGAVLYVAKEINRNLKEKRWTDMVYPAIRELMQEDFDAAEARGEARGEVRGEKRGGEKKMESLKKQAKELENKGLGADQILKELGLV